MKKAPVYRRQASAAVTGRLTISAAQQEVAPYSSQRLRSRAIHLTSQKMTSPYLQIIS